MKGIHGVPYHVIFSVVILVLLLILTVGYVYGKTDIPFEKLWEQGPESGVLTNPSPVTGGSITYEGINPAPHIFTTGNNWDLSEIACSIGKAIYIDYSKHGDSGPRTAIDNGLYDKGYIFGSQTGYLIDSGKFYYTAKADASNTNECLMQTSDPACHLCRQSPSASCSPTPTSASCGSPPACCVSPGSVGIDNLDETCINLQLRDRKIGVGSFCNVNFRSTDGNDGFFGNNDCGANRNVGQPGWNGRCSSFCDGADKIIWSADHDQDSTDWNVTDNGISEEANSESLQDKREYIYGVVWSTYYKNYDVLFAMVPNFSATDTPVTNWFIIDDYFGYNSPTEMYRKGILGKTYPEARIVADYLLIPSQPINNIYNDLIVHLSTIAFQGLTPAEARMKVSFKSCSDLGSCLPSWTPRGDACWTVGGDTFTLMQEKNEPIQVLVDATDSSGSKITDIDYNKDLPAGKTYRIIIQQWYRGWNYWNGLWMDHCYDEYVRSISIIQQ